MTVVLWGKLSDALNLNKEIFFNQVKMMRGPERDRSKRLLKEETQRTKTTENNLLK